MELNGADWALVAIVMLSAAVGLLRGFVKEVLSLAIWAAALFVALFFRTQLALSLPIDDPAISVTVREILAFGVLFLGVLLVGGLINVLIARLIEATGLTGTDRLLGGLFGFGRGLILTLVGLVFLPGIIPVSTTDWWNGSVLIPLFLDFEGWARQITSDLALWISAFF